MFKFILQVAIAFMLVMYNYRCVVDVDMSVEFAEESAMFVLRFIIVAIIWIKRVVKTK